MKELTKQWLDFALDDLKMIRVALEDASLSNMIAFHAEQCVEKCLKAIIEENNIEFLQIHDLSRLFARIEKLVLFEFDKEVFLMLSEVYTSSRYPSELGLLPNSKSSIKDAELFHNFAEDFYIKTKNILEV